MAPANNRSLKLVIIDSDPHARSYLKGYLGEKDVRVIGEADDLKSGQRLVRGLQPDVLVIELPENATETVEFIRRVRDQLPNTAVIIARCDPSPQVILGCIRAGAQEFVGRPLDPTDVERALGHIRKVMDRSSFKQKSRASILSVFSSKGGIGATSIAANLAVALAAHDARTVLVDLSLQLGDLGLMFNQPPRYNLTDAFEDGVLEHSKLRSILSAHDSGVSLLTVAASPEIAEEITRQHIIELFGALSTMFDFIVVDIGRLLDDRTAEALDLSDAILLLSALDVPTIRNVSKYLDIFEQLEIGTDKMHLIVNRFNKKDRLTPKDMEKALGLEVFWRVPNDFEPMSLGIDSGTPAILEATRSKLAQSFRDLANLYVQMFRTPSETVDASTH